MTGSSLCITALTQTYWSLILHNYQQSNSHPVTGKKRRIKLLEPCWRKKVGWRVWYVCSKLKMKQVYQCNFVCFHPQTSIRIQRLRKSRRKKGQSLNPLRCSRGWAIKENQARAPARTKHHRKDTFSPKRTWDEQDKGKFKKRVRERKCIGSRRQGLL